MRILLTGATGYIGKRLLPVLLKEGHEVICCVRDAALFEQKAHWGDHVTVIEVDFLKSEDMEKVPLDFDVAYYLLHSMSVSIGDFEEMEARTAQNFVELIDRSKARQIIFLGGIVNEEKLSEHLQSRLRVEHILSQSRAHLTALRAGIIIGSGSASFEIIRDLVEKLPVMAGPRWLLTRCQPLGIRDVIAYLTGVLLNPECYDQNFDIGGPEVLTYREMLLQYARVRKLKRWVFTFPLISPRVSSYWLYFVTSTTYKLAVNLVNSMKVDVICRDDRLARMLGIEPMPYEAAVETAFRRIEQNMVVSSWTDSMVSSSPKGVLSPYINIPQYGCFQDQKVEDVPSTEVGRVWQNILCIGGERGWYYGNFLWKIRGILDKLVGGIGLRRGRRDPEHLEAGDALDFWRVLVADPDERRLLLYAEMRLPGEAWLEFHLKPSGNDFQLVQTATFRPKGIGGRLYWYSVEPLHFFVFRGMIRSIIKYEKQN